MCLCVCARGFRTVLFSALFRDFRPSKRQRRCSARSAGGKADAEDADADDMSVCYVSYTVVDRAEEESRGDGEVVWVGGW